MNEIIKTYTVDHELASLLKAAARAGERVRVQADEETYELEVKPAGSDLWAGYDPEQVRAAVRRSAAMGSRVEPAELEPLIAEIRTQRDQAPRSSAS